MLTNFFSEGFTVLCHKTRETKVYELKITKQWVLEKKITEWRKKIGMDAVRDQKKME